MEFAIGFIVLLGIVYGFTNYLMRQSDEDCFL